MGTQDHYPGRLHQEGLDKYTDEELLNTLLVDDVRTLYDIQLLYGGLYNLATAVGDAETARYLTPGAANEWFDEPETVVVLKFDLSGGADPFTGVDVMAHSQSLVSKLAHAEYADSGVAKDHSITHIFKGSGKSDPADAALKRLTDWPTDEVVAAVAEENATEDAWVISRLADLGTDSDIRDSVHEMVSQQVERTDGNLITVRVKLTEDGEYLWPNEVDAFAEGMKRLQRDRMATKNLNDSDGSSAGQGVCFGTGEATTVFGTTDDHLQMYKTRQFEKFSGIRVERGWTTHPISLEAALDEKGSETFIDACQVGAFYGSVYHLPYFPGEVTADKVKNLFYTLVQLVRQSEEDGSNAPTARALKDIDDEYEDELRFYTLLVQKPRSTPWRILGEMQNETKFPALDIANAHDELLESVWFDRESDIGLYTYDVQYFQRSRTIDSVASGWYLSETFPDRERHKNSNILVRPDDPRVQAFNALLEGRPIDFDDLVSWYAERLRYVERGDVSEDSDDHYYREEETGIEFPRWRVRRQFIQLCALANAGLIHTKEGVASPTLTDPDRYDQQTTLTTAMTDGSNSPTDDDSTSDEDERSSLEIRREWLETFIDNHPPLKTDPEKNASFLLGVLVGQLGGVQGRNVESTVVDTYPIASVSKNNLARVSKDVLHRNNVYAKKSDTNSDRMFAEVTELLTDAMMTEDPSKWDLSNDMVQFYYGFGVEWGKTHRITNSGSVDTADAQNSTSDEEAAE